METPELNQHRLTISKIRQAVTLIDPVFLQTPQFISKGLSDALNCELTVKIETLNPIKCFKGRGAEVLVSNVKNNQPIVCASAGNFGQAMAYACLKKGIDLTVFASTNANPYKIDRMQHFWAKVIIEGHDFDAAKILARAFAATNGLRFIEDGEVIETLQGAATIGLELMKLPSSLDTLLIPLGNGALFSGIARVFKELSPGTSLVAVQAKGAPAMLDSLRSKKYISHPTVATIADGIAVRLPVAQALIDLASLVDETQLVSDPSIIEAMKLIHHHLGLVVEPSAAVGVAAILAHPYKWKNLRVGTIICGANLTPEQTKDWILG